MPLQLTWSLTGNCLHLFDKAGKMHRSIVSLPTNRLLYLIAATGIATMTAGYEIYCHLSRVVVGDHVFRLYGVVTAILVVSWLTTDPKIPAAQKPSFDHGMLIWISFPLLAAYQMYLAHRWRGILIVLGLFGLFIAPDMALTLVVRFSAR